LGGGSSNAACVLLNLPDLLYRAGHITEAKRKKVSKQLLKESVSLGADVPYFMKVQETISHVAGIGELVRPVIVDDLYGISVFLIVPTFGVSTPDVYAELRKRSFDEEECVAQELRVLDSLDDRHPYSWLLERLENDLLQSTQVVAPEMKRIFALGNKVSDVVFMQSGSGSTFFALPKSIDFDELAIENALKEKFSGKNVEIIKTNLLAKPDY
jgi:4-diphosphocytidyl-2C-methyl-D-erythritol kinase